MGKPEPEEKVPGWWFSTRFMITMLGSLCFAAMFALRVSFSLTLVCMVNQTALDLIKAQEVAVANNHVNHYGENGSTTGMSIIYSMHNQTLSGSGNMSMTVPPEESCHGRAASGHAHKDGPFVWDKTVQGFMFSGFFIGYVLIEIPAGWLGTRFGAKRMLAVFMLMASVASLLSPMAARVHYGFLVALRVITGIGSGVVFPLVTVVLGRWSPPLETSRMGTITYAGAQIGCLLALVISGQICERGLLGGWHTVFYMFGVFGIVWCILWMFLASDTPREHPRISQEEKEYIIKSLNEDLHHDKKVAYVPWKDLLMSIPFWAIVVTSACTDFGYLIFETNTPSYVKEVLKFDMESNGLLSAAPFLGIWIISVAGAFILDALRERHILTTGQARKIAEAIGMILPAGLFVGISYMDCHQWLAAATMLVLGVSLIGGQYCGHFVNNMDIAPRFAGVVMAITNAVGSVMGILAPLLVGVVTHEQTREQWQIVFFIAAGVYVVGIIVFVIFASGEVQPWALDLTFPEKEQITVELGEFKKPEANDGSVPQAGEPLLNGIDKNATHV